MKKPLQITYRNIESNHLLDGEIRRRAADLEQYHQAITRIRVVVEGPSNHHRNGQHYHVRIELSVPGRELVADRDPAQHTANEEPFFAVREAFEAAERELKKYVEQRRAELTQRRRAEPYNPGA